MDTETRFAQGEPIPAKFENIGFKGIKPDTLDGLQFCITVASSDDIETPIITVKDSEIAKFPNDGSPFVQGEFSSSGLAALTSYEVTLWVRYSNADIRLNSYVLFLDKSTSPTYT